MCVFVSVKKKRNGGEKKGKKKRKKKYNKKIQADAAEDTHGSLYGCHALLSFNL